MGYRFVCCPQTTGFQVINIQFPPSTTFVFVTQKIYPASKIKFLMTSTIFGLIRHTYTLDYKTIIGERLRV